MGNVVNEGGTSLHKAASVDVNAAVGANVDAAVAAAEGLRLVGFSAKESAGTPAAATAVIVHGATGAGGTAVAYINLAASGSTTVSLGDGVACDSGISIDWLTGQLDVCLHYKVVT